MADRHPLPTNRNHHSYKQKVLSSSLKDHIHKGSTKQPQSILTPNIIVRFGKIRPSCSPLRQTKCISSDSIIISCPLFNQNQSEWGPVASDHWPQIKWSGLLLLMAKFKVCWRDTSLPPPFHIYTKLYKNTFEVLLGTAFWTCNYKASANWTCSDIDYPTSFCT